MGMIQTLSMVGVLMAAAAAAQAAEPAEAPPTWPWPGPTPPEILDTLMKKGVFQPNERELAQIEALAPDKPTATPAKARRILVWGRLYRHLCNPFTEQTVKILGRKTGAFEVVAGDDPRLLLPDSLREFDALFLNGLHERTPFLPPWLKSMPKEEQDAAQELDRKVKESILKFVGEDGKGVAGIKGSIAALQSWQEFGEMMGAFCAGHYVGNFVIKVEDPTHPLTACFGAEPFRIFDQAYVPGPPYSRKNLRILLTLDLTQTPDPVADEKMAWLRPAIQRLEESTGRRELPISWIKPYGKGRVFYCSLGVQKQAYSNPLFLRYLLDGVQFAIGDLPADMTPTEQ